MPIAHSVFKQTVLNVSANQLQQQTIEICCKMILSYQLTREANHSVLSTKRSSVWHVFDSLVFQHSSSQMIIHWHIYMVHFLLF